MESSRKCKDIAYCNLSSMGIYLINRDIIVQLLKEHFPKANDFTSEVIPGAISIGMKVRLIVHAVPLWCFSFQSGNPLSFFFFSHSYRYAVVVVCLFSYNY